MPDPINYAATFSDVPSVFQSMLSGYQGGFGMQQAERTKQIQERQDATALETSRQLAVAQKEAKERPSADAYARLTALNPQAQEAYKSAWAMQTDAQQQANLNRNSSILNAFQSGKPEVAVSTMRSHADALGDTPEGKKLKVLADIAEKYPELIAGQLKAQIAANPKGAEYLKAIGAAGAEERARELQPGLVAVGQAEAGIKGAEAGVAKPKAALGVQKVAEEIETAQAQRRIAELDTQIKQANSETERGRLQVERDKLQFEVGKKKGDVGADAQTQMDTATQALSTIEGLMKHPLMSSSFGVGSTVGKLLGQIPGTDNKDFRAQVETLKAQQFMQGVQAMKGLGALSDAEGSRIERAVASLDADQSPAAFKNALGTIRSTLEKAQQKLVAGGRLPATGGAFVLKHPVYGNVSDGDINRLMTKFPGATREQVMTYLRESGGQDAPGAAAPVARPAPAGMPPPISPSGVLPNQD